MDKSRRKNEISLLNVLLCLLVILIHVTAHPVSVLDKTELSYLYVFIPWRLSAFVVQGFILLSGVKLFLKSGKNESILKFYYSRLKTVVLPYIIWALIYYFYFLKEGFYDFSFSSLLDGVLLGNAAGHLYFVVIIVQFYLLMPIFKKLYLNVHPVIMIPFSLLITIIFGQFLPSIISSINPDIQLIYNDRFFTTYFFYWTVGCYIGIYYEEFISIIKKGFYGFLAMFVTSLLFDCYLSYLPFVVDDYPSFLESVHILYCISAILFFYGLFLNFSEKKIPALIMLTDRASYKIYLSHVFVMVVADKIMQSYGIYDVWGSFYIRIISVYIVTITLCILYEVIKKKFDLKKGEFFGNKKASEKRS